MAEKYGKLNKNQSQSQLKSNNSNSTSTSKAPTMQLPATTTTSVRSLSSESLGYLIQSQLHPTGTVMKSKFRGCIAIEVRTSGTVPVVKLIWLTIYKPPSKDKYFESKLDSIDSVDFTYSTDQSTIISIQTEQQLISITVLNSDQNHIKLFQSLLNELLQEFIATKFHSVIVSQYPMIPTEKQIEATIRNNNNTKKSGSTATTTTTTAINNSFNSRTVTADKSNIYNKLISIPANSTNPARMLKIKNAINNKQQQTNKSSQQQQPSILSALKSTKPPTIDNRYSNTDFNSKSALEVRPFIYNGNTTGADVGNESMNHLNKSKSNKIVLSTDSIDSSSDGEAEYNYQAPLMPVSLTRKYPKYEPIPNYSNYRQPILNQSLFNNSFNRSLGQQKGFRNVGNSCYMNAVLQSLLSIPAFINQLCEDSIIGVKHSKLLRPLNPDSFYNCLVSVVNQHRNSDHGVIDTRQLKDSFGARYKRFAGFNQQDAHEFLTECLNHITEDIAACITPIRTTVIDQSKQQQQQSIESDSVNNDSIIPSILMDSGSNKENESENINRDKPITTATVPASINHSVIEIDSSADAGAVDSDNDIPSNTNQLNKLSAPDPIIMKSAELISPAEINFHCEVEYTLRCSNIDCTESSRKTIEHFNIFSLDIPQQLQQQQSQSSPSPTIDINQLLKNFFLSTELDCKCPNPDCSSSKVYVTSKINRLPRVLILHIKRFTPNDTGTNYEKRTDKIHINSFLDLRNWCSAPQNKSNSNSPISATATATVILDESTDTDNATYLFPPQPRVSIVDSYNNLATVTNQSPNSNNNSSSINGRGAAVKRELISVALETLSTNSNNQISINSKNSINNKRLNSNSPVNENQSIPIPIKRAKLDSSNNTLTPISSNSNKSQLMILLEGDLSKLESELTNKSTELKLKFDEKTRQARSINKINSNNNDNNISSSSAVEELQFEYVIELSRITDEYNTKKEQLNKQLKAAIAAKQNDTPADSKSENNKLTEYSPFSSIDSEDEDFQRAIALSTVTMSQEDIELEEAIKLSLIQPTATPSPPPPPPTTTTTTTEVSNSILVADSQPIDSQLDNQSQPQSQPQPQNSIKSELLSPDPKPKSKSNNTNTNSNNTPSVNNTPISNNSTNNKSDFSSPSSSINSYSNISSGSGNPYGYALLSIVHHRGTEAYSGHYIADVRDDISTAKVSETSIIALNDSSNTTPITDIPTISRPRWKRYDDQYLTSINHSTVIKTAHSDGYLLFYSYDPKSAAEIEKMEKLIRKKIQSKLQTEYRNNHNNNSNNNSNSNNKLSSNTNNAKSSLSNLSTPTVTVATAAAANRHSV